MDSEPGKVALEFSLSSVFFHMSALMKCGSFVKNMSCLVDFRPFKHFVPSKIYQTFTSLLLR